MQNLLSIYHQYGTFNNFQNVIFFTFIDINISPIPRSYLIEDQSYKQSISVDMNLQLSS